MREQFRIADGEAARLRRPRAPSAHSIEFRINGEDAGRNFLPAARRRSAVFEPPSGPGVRLDSGVVEGDVIGGAFDSMLAKLIVTGHDRQQALERSRRALAEFEVDGMPTVLPFHRGVVADPAFAPEGDKPFTVHTRWIETEFDNQIEPYAGAVARGARGVRRAPDASSSRSAASGSRSCCPAGSSLGGGTGARRRRRRAAPAASQGRRRRLRRLPHRPMQGTIVKIAVEEGQQVAEGDLVVVLEAMKMEQPINAHKAGTITGLLAEVGQTVTNGAVIAEIKD